MKSSLTIKITAGCLLILHFVFSVIACQPSAPADTDIYQVIRVIDGDTIVVNGNMHVRYIGMNTPEMNEPLGEAARKANKTLVQGKRVRLERDVTDTDRYGRWLRYIYVDNLMVNGELVRLGLAKALYYPPDTKYQAYLESLEREARQAKRGLWSQ